MTLEPQTQDTTTDDRARLRLAVLDAANTVDVALDETTIVATAMLVELVDRLEEVLDTVAA